MFTRAKFLLAGAALLGISAFSFHGVLAQPGPLLDREKVFFGNLHSHTSYSDGQGTPREAFAYARDTAMLDFLAITEHNHAQAMGADNLGIAADHSLYTGPGKEALIPAAGEFNVDGRFVALYGQEFSSISKGNHVNVFDIGQVITAENGRFDQLLDFLQLNPDSSGQPPVIMFNHPLSRPTLDPKEYGRDDFAGESQWIEKMGRAAALLEIVNGPSPQPGSDRPPPPMEGAYLKFLNLGFKLAPTADQDNHAKAWGTATTARTAIIAESLTKAALLDAMRQRHVYASEDANLKVIITVNDHLCGDVIRAVAPGQLNIQYRISDADEPQASYEIQTFQDTIGGPIARQTSSFTTPTGGGTGTLPITAFDSNPRYLFFKIVQHTDGTVPDHVWTAPVWLEPAGP